LGLAKNDRLRAEITAELVQASEQYQQTGQAARIFKEFSYQTRESWARARRVVAKAVEAGVAVPAFMTALAFFDGYRSARLPANLLQAQRDYFGAHTYERVDREGKFHTQWIAES